MKTNRFGVFAVVSFLAVFSAFAPGVRGDTIAYVSWIKNTSPFPSMVQQVDLDTGAITTIGTYSQEPMQIAFSPADHNLYAVVSGSAYGGTWEIDPTTGSITSVWGPKNLPAIGFAPDGTLYAHGGAGQYLSKYDLADHTGGTFGNKLPLTFHGLLGGIAIDSSGDAFTATQYQHLYSVNLTDGDLTDLGIPKGMPFGVRSMAYDSSDRLLACFDTGIYSIDVGSMTTTKIMSLTAPTGFMGQSFAVASVPEPATATLLITGLLAGSAMLRRRRK